MLNKPCLLNPLKNGVNCTLDFASQEIMPVKECVDEYRESDGSFDSIALKDLNSVVLTSKSPVGTKPLSPLSTAVTKDEYNYDMSIIIGSEYKV